MDQAQFAGVAIDPLRKPVDGILGRCEQHIVLQYVVDIDVPALFPIEDGNRPSAVGI